MKKYAPVSPPQRPVSPKAEVGGHAAQAEPPSEPPQATQPDPAPAGAASFALQTEAEEPPASPKSRLMGDAEDRSRRISFLFGSIEELEDRLGDICEKASEMEKRWGEDHARRWLNWQFRALAYARIKELIREHAPFKDLWDALLARIGK